jgi:hypothetical protein
LALLIFIALTPRPAPRRASPARSYAVRDASNNAGSLNYTYYFNFCKDVDPSTLQRNAPTVCASTTPGGGNSAPTTTGPAAAFQAAELPFFPGPNDQCHRLGGATTPTTASLGLINPANPSRGVYIQYTGGDACVGFNPPARTLRVYLQCDPDTVNIPDQELVEETSTCYYEIYVKSAWGCPTECPIVKYDDGSSALCSNHGLCEFDYRAGNSHCFCNDGYGGADCGTRVAAQTGLSATSTGLIVVCVFLTVALAGLLYVWMRIRGLRLDPAAYSALRAGPGEEASVQ